MKYTLKKRRKLKIWVTEVVCNLLMNNKQIEATEILCDRGASSMCCLLAIHTLFAEPFYNLTGEKASRLSADCKRLSCSNTTRTILQFCNSTLGCFLFF